MKAPLCCMLAALLCTCTMLGCQSGRDIPTGCLTTVVETQSKTTTVEPVWLDPDAGTVTPVCDEETHGADCPFYGLDDSVRSYLTQGDDGKLYFFTEVTADTGERTATLWEYSCKTGKKKEIGSRTDTTWRSKTILQNGYLIEHERDADGEEYAVTCMALSDRTREKYPLRYIPAAIQETKNGSVAYGALLEENGYIRGFYEMDWTFPPTDTERRLLFYDPKCRIGRIWFEDDAIYWRGRMRENTEDASESLYRYDPSTDETTEVCGQFSSIQMLGHGDFFYYFQKVDSPNGETRYDFTRLRKSTGESKVVDTLPEEWRYVNILSVYEDRWILMRLKKADSETEGFYCWNVATEEARILSAADSVAGETR